MSRFVMAPWFIGPAGTEYLCRMARPAIQAEVMKISAKARRLLAAADSTVKIADPSGLTRIESGMEGNDGYVGMWGYKNGALAIEFGHQPSGYFANIPSKAPAGLYIITRAAGI